LWFVLFFLFEKVSFTRCGNFVMGPLARQLHNASVRGCASKALKTREYLEDCVFCFSFRERKKKRKEGKRNNMNVQVQWNAKWLMCMGRWLWHHWVPILKKPHTSFNNVIVFSMMKTTTYLCLCHGEGAKCVLFHHFLVHVKLYYYYHGKVYCMKRYSMIM